MAESKSVRVTPEDLRVALVELRGGRLVAADLVGAVEFAGPGDRPVAVYRERGPLPEGQAAGVRAALVEEREALRIAEEG